MLSDRALKAVARRAIQLIEERGFRQGKRGPGLCVGLIPRWNDKPGRTKEEAIELLRRVAAHDTPFTYRDSRGLVHA